MKTKKVFLMLLSLIIIGMVGCEDKSDELIWEISPENGQTIIQNEVDGIAFKFCLLNEAEEPATVFNERENLIFSFSIKNNLGRNISVLTNFIDSAFYRVHRQTDNADMGKPWTGLWCEYKLSDKKIEIDPSKTYQLNCPWILTENNQPDYPICMSESKAELPVGNYYTVIHLNFQYFQGDQQKNIKNVIFKINFKIQ